LQGAATQLAVAESIPFFVDPPGALDYGGAKILSERIGAANLIAAVGFSNRYADLFLEAREYLGANPVPLALAWWLSPSDEDVTTAADRLLWSDACLMVDAMRFFCGEANRVRALPVSAGSPQAGLVVQIEFAAGTVGVLTCTRFVRPDPRIELEFLGEGWSLGFRDGLSTLWLGERDKTTILRCLNEPAAEHAAAFLAALATGNAAALTSSYGDALRTLAICEAAAISARESRAVDLAEIL
jgi:predicted dehydrogenase